MYAYQKRKQPQLSLERSPSQSSSPLPGSPLHSIQQILHRFVSGKSPSPQEDALYLQRTIGNQALAHYIQGAKPPLQLQRQPDDSAVAEAQSQESSQTTQAREPTPSKKSSPPAKPARLYIHTDIDVPKISIRALQEGAVGHAWVSLEWKDPKQVPETVEKRFPKHAKFLKSSRGPFADPFGFWPYMWQYNEAIQEFVIAPDRVGYSTNPFKSYVKGQVLHPDRKHSPKASQSWDITEGEAMRVMEYAESKKNAKYSVFFFNCTTFAKEAVEAAGKKPPSSTTAGIAYPNALYEGILKNYRAKKGTTTLYQSNGQQTTVQGSDEDAKK
ncbi:MAG: hypothetical protein D6805_07080 [Planctomycetota bacterium]|nr:MAG: hypothetical protein D6805_07080 [Planctomycetota bacterium]